MWHGTADTVVKPSNAEHIINQWVNVQGLQREPSELEHGARYMRRVWSDRNGEPQLEAFSVAGMAHGVPLATTGQDACGTVGPFFIDAGISATNRIIRFWELERELGEFATAKESRSGAIVGAFALKDANTRGPSSGPEQDADAAQTIGSILNPGEVIAAAFKAAGLPSPDNREGPAGAKVDPASIIAAALKAAGLSRP